VVTWNRNEPGVSYPSLPSVNFRMGYLGNKNVSLGLLAPFYLILPRVEAALVASLHLWEGGVVVRKRIFP
jgi:hypothetical protein